MVLEIDQLHLMTPVIDILIQNQLQMGVELFYKVEMEQ